MNEETVSISETDRDRVERVRREAAYRQGKVPEPAPLPPTIAKEAAAVVMDPKNPHLSIYREFRAGLITFDEMQSAIDTQVCADLKIINQYKYKILPEKPQALRDAEQEICLQTARMGEMKKKEVMKDFQITAQEQFKSYYRAVEKVNEENLSNLHTLKEMLERQRTKNTVFASRIQDVIDTH